MTGLELALLLAFVAVVTLALARTLEYGSPARALLARLLSAARGRWARLWRYDPGLGAHHPDARVQLERLALANGDVIVMRVRAQDDPDAVRHLMRVMTAHLRYLGLEGCLVIGVEPGYDLELLDDTAMARWGWVRPANSHAHVTGGN